MKILFSILWLGWSVAGLLAQDERLPVAVKINGQPATMFFDTGSAADFVLFQPSVKKFGLNFTPPLPTDQASPGGVLLGLTESCRLEVMGTNLSLRFKVLNIPAYMKYGGEGVLGWPGISGNILWLNLEKHELLAVSNVPPACLAWPHFRICTNYEYLVLELPTRNGVTPLLAIDSGSGYGVELGPERWQKWKSTHPRQPRSYEAYYSPSSGVIAKEEAWAETILIGPLALTGVPVKESSEDGTDYHVAPHTEYLGTLGLSALKRLDVVLDGRHGLAYLHPRESAPVPYDHNRLGAVFIPANRSAVDLVASVAPDSPAFAAGIRNQDVLLAIDGLDTTQWRTDPKVLPLSRFWGCTAGTKYTLTLRRGASVFQAVVQLRNIISPEALPVPGKE